MREEGSRGSFEAIPREAEGPLLAIGALVMTVLLLLPSLRLYHEGGGGLVTIVLAGGNAFLGLVAVRKRCAALALCVSLILAAVFLALPPSPLYPVICFLPAAFWFEEDLFRRPRREERADAARLEILKSGAPELWLGALNELSSERVPRGIEALLSNPEASITALDRLTREIPKPSQSLLSLARLKSSSDAEQRRLLIGSVLETIDEAPAPEELALALLEACKTEAERALLSPAIGKTKSVAANLMFALRYARTRTVIEAAGSEPAQRLAEIAVTGLIACDREIELSHLLYAAEELWILCDETERENQAVEMLELDPSPSLILALGPQLRMKHAELLQSLSERDEPENLSALAVVLEEPALAELRGEISNRVVARVRERHPLGENPIADQICRGFERIGGERA